MAAKRAARAGAQPVEKSVVEHARIAEAVLAGDGVRAETLMADHLSRLRTMLVGIMKAFHYPG